ncbi:MAG: Mov34/MPN/PAD-1 family protein [Candidatus Symbiothrix sp.]|nr:Mov34/MPN/PAD-1 family protein [Candidatus Symbiothrix sp.]
MLKKTRKDGEKIMANYHSHPETPARPSEEDIRLACDPNIIYIIISLAQKTPVVKAFVKTDTDEMQPYEIEIVQKKKHEK